MFRVRAPFGVGILVLAGLVLGMTAGCGPSAAEKERMGKLARVKKVALVGFVGKSEANPTGTVHAQLTQQMYEAFRDEAEKHRDVVEFLPLAQVLENDAYKRIAKIQMVPGVVSGVDGLTYPEQGLQEGGSFDWGPLAQALKADAVMLVVTEFGVSVRNNGSSFFATADTRSAVILPPEDLVHGTWKTPAHREANLDMFVPLKLSLAIGAKWVVMAPPSPAEYDEITRIAIDREVPLAAEAGKQLAASLAADIIRARKQE